jgi:pimeloyl-ACP methyl ester carboxylesterase
MLLAFLLVPQLSFSQTSENKGSTDGLAQVDGSRIYYQECGSGPSAVVKDIHAPTLIMTGSADIADNQAVAGALVLAIPGAARVVMPDAGHLPYLEKPDVFYSIMNGFLKRHGF